MSEFNINQIIRQSIYVVRNCSFEQFCNFIETHFYESPLISYHQDNDSVYYTLYLGDIALQSSMFPSDNSSQCINQFSDCAVLLARLISDELPF